MPRQAGCRCTRPLKAGLARMKEIGGAKPGDRTMVDRAPTRARSTRSGACPEAAEAARAGAEQHPDRWRRLPRRAVRISERRTRLAGQTSDPGAEAVARLFENLTGLSRPLRSPRHCGAQGCGRSWRAIFPARARPRGAASDDLPHRGPDPRRSPHGGREGVLTASVAGSGPSGHRATCKVLCRAGKPSDPVGLRRIGAPGRATWREQRHGSCVPFPNRRPTAPLKRRASRHENFALRPIRHGQHRAWRIRRTSRHCRHPGAQRATAQSPPASRRWPRPSKTARPVRTGVVVWSTTVTTRPATGALAWAVMHTQHLCQGIAAPSCRNMRMPARRVRLGLDMAANRLKARRRLADLGRPTGPGATRLDHPKPRRADARRIVRLRRLRRPIPRGARAARRGDHALPCLETALHERRR